MTTGFKHAQRFVLFRVDFLDRLADPRGFRLKGGEHFLIVTFMRGALQNRHALLRA